MLQRPAFMPGMGGYPVNSTTNIIEYKGVRTSDTAPPVPFLDAGVFTKPFDPAIAANPYLAFWLRADGPGTLSFEWSGDWGFQHRETRAIQPA